MLASPKLSMQAFILGGGYESRFEMAFILRYSIQKRKDPSDLGTNTTSEAHSESKSSITQAYKIFRTLARTISLALWPAL